MKWISTGADDNYDDEIEWKPDGADEISGILVSKRTVETKYGPTTIIKLDVDGQINKIWGSRTALKTLFEQYDDELTIGREVGLRSKAMITLANGNTFRPYEIGFGDTIVAAPSDVPVDEPF